MRNFKIGDKVRRIAGNNRLPVGTECTVRLVNHDGDLALEEKDGWYASYNFELVRHVYPNPPHKHAEVIKAWADGAEIEFFGQLSRKWSTVPQPTWDVNYTYRIKPSNPNADKIAELEKTIDQAKKQLQELKNENY